MEFLRRVYWLLVCFCVCPFAVSPSRGAIRRSKRFMLARPLNYVTWKVFYVRAAKFATRENLSERGQKKRRTRRQGEARMKFSFYLLSCIQPLCLAVSTAKSCSKNWNFLRTLFNSWSHERGNKSNGRVSQLKQFILNWILCGSWIHSKARLFVEASRQTVMRREVIQWKVRDGMYDCLLGSRMLLECIGACKKLLGNIQSKKEWKIVYSVAIGKVQGGSNKVATILIVQGGGKLS